MGKGLGAAYAREWRSKNPEMVIDYRRSLSGKYAQLKRAAKRGNREFTISYEEYCVLVESNTCYYCNGPLCIAGYSLDRLNNKLGYTKENSVPCCGNRNGSRKNSCNFRKGHLEAAGLCYPRTVEILKEMLSEEK